MTSPSILVCAWCTKPMHSIYTLGSVLDRCQCPWGIFVFGSNEAGRHGAGAAKYAVEHHRAIYGVGVGMQGESYAIPTKDHSLNVLPLEKIKEYIDQFLEVSRIELEFGGVRKAPCFKVTNIGCGLAGYTPEQIAPMFADAPVNCMLTPEFKKVLGRP